MPINPSFIDVDFARQPQYVKGDLGVRPGFACANYEDSVEVIPESKWRDEVAAMDAAGGGCDLLVTRTYNQKNEGSCVANACSQANEIIQAKQFGKDRVVHLSAMSLYKRIGSGPNSGAMVSDGLDEMAERGVLPLDDEANKARFKHTMPNTGWSNRYPEGWEETAKMFRAVEWFVINSRAGLITALLNQHPVVVGRAGHSICYCRPMYEGTKLFVKYKNSWGAWGDDGYGYDSENLIRSSSGWAFALRAVVVPS